MDFPAKICLPVFALLAAALLFGCLLPEPSPTNEIKDTIIVSAYVAPSDPNNLDEFRIATIKVSQGGSIMPTPEPGMESSAEYLRLTNALQDIRSRKTLELSFEDIEIIDGQEALVMKTASIAPDNKDYIYAVREALSLQYGFDCEVE